MKKYIIGTCGSLVIFLISLVFLTIPGFIGIENIEMIDTNNLFLSATLLYSLVHFVYYVTCITEPNNEEIFLSLASSTSGLLNVFFSKYLNSTLSLSCSITIFMLFLIAVKLYTIDYFKNNKDPYYYLEILMLVIFIIVNTVIIFNLNTSSVINTLMLGFIFIIISILDILNVFLKNIFKSKKFLFKEIIR